MCVPMPTHQWQILRYTAYTGAIPDFGGLKTLMKCVCSKKKVLRFLNVSPTNQLKVLTGYFAQVLYHLRWLGSPAILCGECMGLHVHFNTTRNSDILAPVVLPWFFTIRGECSLKHSVSTTKYCGELSFLRVTRTEFC